VSAAQPSAVLFVTPECAPLTKTGGLGDVSAALPAALRRAGTDVRVLLPGYPAVMDALPLRAAAALPAGFPGDARLLEGELPGGVPLLVLDHAPAFRRAGGPYVDASGRDWPDNPVRFALLSRVAALLGTAASPLAWRPDVVHGNDWPAGLASAYLHFSAARHAASLFTIHNLAFQGIFSRGLLAPLGLPEASFTLEGLEFHGSISFLKAGIVYSDCIATVSPTYAREIQSDVLGFGLGGLLRARSGRLVGIANGIDTEMWDPAADALIPRRYGSDTLDDKRLNKEALQRRMELPAEPGVPLAGIVSRFTGQKGIDLVARAATALAELPLQIVAVGTGQADVEQAMLAAAARHPDRIATRIAFDEPLAHLVEAASDMFLMPSRFEPCGLNQMYSQRYGTPPVAHATGGLADTIVDCSEAALRDGTATGFLFHEAEVPAMVNAVRRAVALYGDAPRWRRLQQNGMARDFSWAEPAARYARLYEALSSA
jgi:starch synthase